MEQYKVEPYVVAADVYAVSPHTGRGGWTWYTGSAGWMYRLVIESLLGIRREGGALRVEARMPRSWTGFRFTYRHGATIYRIEVVAADGERVAPEGGTLIPLNDNGGEHAVEVIAAR